MYKLTIKLILLLFTSQYLLAEFKSPRNNQDLEQVREYIMTYNELYMQDGTSKDIKNRISTKGISKHELQNLQRQFLDRQEKLMLDAKNKVNLSDKLFNENKKPMELDITSK